MSTRWRLSCSKICIKGRVIYVKSLEKKLFIPIICMIIVVCYVHLMSEHRTSNEPCLEHFKRNRSLKHYMNSIDLLTDPTSTPCDGLGEVPLLVLVSSAPGRYEQRDAVRFTWGKQFPTYFVLGVNPRSEDMEIIYLEAKQYDDMIIYDYRDHYQNLTLKTALMLRWTLYRCANAGAMLKTEDDVLLNPWTLPKVLKEHSNAKLIGYKLQDAGLIRDEHEKWYLPRWLYPADTVPRYLTGPAYFVHGDYVKKILDAAADVPLINIEDIYFTYLVASAELGLEMSHEYRMSPWKPKYSFACNYWRLASVHSLSPDDMVYTWSRLTKIAKYYDDNKSVLSVKVVAADAYPGRVLFERSTYVSILVIGIF